MSSHDAMFPLERLPPREQARIAELVAAPTPPPKWLDLGVIQLPSRAWYEWYRQRGLRPDRRERIPDAVRQHVIARDGLVCQLCGEPVDAGDVHLDHKHPRSLGGGNGEANLQVTHSLCNLRKGARG